MSGSASAVRMRMKVLVLVTKSRKLCSILQPSAWTDAYEIEGKRDQENDEGSHPKPTRPAPPPEIIHDHPSLIRFKS